MTHYTDDELYRLLVSDGPEREHAFAEVYARHSSRIYLYCRKIVADAALAEDLFQDTFLKVLQHARDGGEVRHVAAFLLRVARNLCLNAKRDRRDNGVMFEEFHAPSSDRPLESVELERLIERALQHLPSEHREAFVLQMYDGLSYQEIADLTNVQLTTVRNRVVRAKKKLRALLSAYVETTRP